MTDKLRIELDAAEKENYSVVAIVFRRRRDGGMSISEEWGHMDEIFSNGCDVAVPPRIWAEALTWFTAP